MKANPTRAVTPFGPTRTSYEWLHYATRTSRPHEEVGRNRRPWSGDVPVAETAFLANAVITR